MRWISCSLWKIFHAVGRQKNGSGWARHANVARRLFDGQVRMNSELLSLVALVIALTSTVINYLVLRLQRDPEVGRHWQFLKLNCLLNHLKSNAPGMTRKCGTWIKNTKCFMDSIRLESCPPRCRRVCFWNPSVFKLVFSPSAVRWRSVTSSPSGDGTSPWGMK